MTYQPAIWQPFYNESFTNRNLSSSPLTVGALQGDTYDYKLIFIQYSAGSNSLTSVRPNGDSSKNYRRYRLYAEGSTINVEYDSSLYDTLPINSTGTNASNTGLFIGEILSKSGSERVISFVWGNNYNTTYYSQQGSYWWKNTADELTSLVFHGDNVAINFDLIILRKLKVAQDGEWELIERKPLSSTSLSAGVWFSRLNGDRDKEYLLRGCFTASAADSVLAHLNGDVNTNYTTELLLNNAGSASASINASGTGIYLGSSTANAAQPITFEAHIKATSGIYREARVLTGGGSASVSNNGLLAEWWRNSASNIESIKIICGANATGYIELYRRGKLIPISKPTFETLAEVSVDGEFSQGHTFNLAGLGIPDADNETMFVLEYHGNSKTADQINMALVTIFNDDTGNNYALQDLNAGQTTATAFAQTQAYLSYWLCGPVYPSLVRFYILPKSGKYRLALSQGGLLCNASAYSFCDSVWWLNTADKLRSIKVYAASANQTQFKGKITLKRLVF